MPTTKSIATVQASAKLRLRARELRAQSAALAARATAAMQTTTALRAVISDCSDFWTPGGLASALLTAWDTLDASAQAMLAANDADDAHGEPLTLDDALLITLDRAVESLDEDALIVLSARLRTMRGVLGGEPSVRDRSQRRFRPRLSA
jgi:hypothetical protein